jgi:hypothetical protein
MNISVPAQTDPAYSAIASNQCSWAAAEFAIHSDELISAVYNNNMTEFQRIYCECLLKASKLREASGQHCLYGENIDTPVLETHYTRAQPGERYLNILEHCTVLKNEDPAFVEILHPDLAREFYTRVHSLRPLESSINSLTGGVCLLASRHGQSLCILSLGSMYLICDSHLHVARLATKEEMMNHVLMDHGGHLHLTLMLVAPAIAP